MCYVCFVLKQSKWKQGTNLNKYKKTKIRTDRKFTFAAETNQNLKRQPKFKSHTKKLICGDKEKKQSLQLAMKKMIFLHFHQQSIQSILHNQVFLKFTLNRNQRLDNLSLIIVEYIHMTNTCMQC